MSCASRRLCMNFVNFARVPMLIEATSVPWHSIGLDGERHEIRLILNRPGAGHVAARLARMMPDHEFAIPGLLVADIAVTAVDCTFVATILTLEALTLKAPPEENSVKPGRTPG